MHPGCCQLRSPHKSASLGDDQNMFTTEDALFITFASTNLSDNVNIFRIEVTVLEVYADIKTSCIHEK